ncbi:MAG: hypothetical protein HYX97_06520 [Chloroflexi bacterium]|nr:hypothetical protein [Chloroflexota bacterium]
MTIKKAVLLPRENRLALKECPRCSGDLYTNSDSYGPYTECLQCGYMGYLELDDASMVAGLKAKAKKAA